jgi:hypothetical protein
MPGYVDNDMRGRYRFAEESIASCAETISHPDVISLIGGYGLVADMVLGSLYVPNKRDGVYVAPSGNKLENGIAYIPLYEGEDALIDPVLISQFHRLQQKSLRTQFENAGLRYGDSEFKSHIGRLVEARRSTLDRPFHLRFNDDIPYAQVNYALSTENYIGNGHRVKHIPVVTEFIDKFDRRRQVLLHELVHVYQNLLLVMEPATPSVLTDSSMELEAYFVSTNAAIGLEGETYVMDHLPLQYSLEALRRTENDGKNDLFDMTSGIQTRILEYAMVDDRSVGAF